MNRQQIHIVCLVLLLFFPYVALAQGVSITYQYWLDNNTDQVTTASGTDSGDGVDINLSLDVGGTGLDLNPGVHYYNIRAAENGEWGAVQRFIFSIPAVASGDNPADLKNVEYWFDDDYANRVSTTASSSQATTASLNISEVDVSSLAPGVHYYNMRAQDENGIWGAPQRFIFSIPTPQNSAADKLIAGYSYAFIFEDPTIVALDTPVDEYTLELSDLPVPDPEPLMVVDDDCTMTFDATAGTAQLSRNVPMTFAVYFKDQSNTLSAPTVEEFEVNDVITEDVQTIASPGTYAVESHVAGGYSAMSFAVESSTILALKANGDCSLRLYNPDGELIIAYESTALQTGVTMTFPAGSYYAIVFGNSEARKLALYPGDEEGMEALKPTISFNEDTHVVTINSTITGANYYYTTDGSEPTLESTLYTTSFTAANNMTVKAIAAWGDMVISPSRSYMISTIKGDASGDGTIDIADVTAIINYILGNPSSTFAENLADMNGDGVVDIFDAMLLLNNIINNTPTTPSGARRVYQSGEATAEQILLATEQKNIYIGIDQAERFTSFQFDLTLPTGIELTDAKLASGANTHRLMFAHHGENTYRVIGYSLKNELLPSAGDKLIELLLSDAAEGNVSVNNILFVTPNEQKVWMAAKSISSTTQIDGVEMDTEAKDIYKLNGQKVGDSRKQLNKGVYIINHKKVIIK